jgi:nicotinate phosphoribosyltransferase
MFPHVFKTYTRYFRLEGLMVPVFLKGKLVYESPSVHKIRENTLRNLQQLDPAYKRFHNPHTYHVSLSSTLFRVKQRLMKQAMREETAALADEGAAK